MYTASFDLGSKMALPNQWGQDAGLCKLMKGLLNTDACHGSTFGGGGGIGNAVLVLVTCGDIVGDALATCDIGGETTVT